jgi:hypothetical protein
MEEEDIPDDGYSKVASLNASFPKYTYNNITKSFQNTNNFIPNENNNSITQLTQLTQPGFLKHSGMPIRPLEQAYDDTNFSQYKNNKHLHEIAKNSSGYKDGGLNSDDGYYTSANGKKFKIVERDEKGNPTAISDNYGPTAIFGDRVVHRGENGRFPGADDTPEDEIKSQKGLDDKIKAGFNFVGKVAGGIATAYSAYQGAKEVYDYLKPVNEEPENLNAGEEDFEEFIPEDPDVFAERDFEADQQMNELERQMTGGDEEIEEEFGLAEEMAAEEEFGQAEEDFGQDFVNLEYAPGFDQEIADIKENMANIYEQATGERYPNQEWKGYSRLAGEDAEAAEEAEAFGGTAGEGLAEGLAEGVGAAAAEAEGAAFFETALETALEAAAFVIFP